VAETYITIPVETDPEDVLNDAYDMMQTLVPGWQPSDGNLDVWLLQAIASIASESRDVTSEASKSIFRWFGNSLMNLPPIDATPAAGTTTWTMVDNLGYTIPAGTQVTMADSTGTDYAFETQQDVIVYAGNTATAAGAVQIVAVDEEYGAAANGLTNPVSLLDPLVFVASITITAPTSGGQDAESDDDYLDRLAATLELLAPRPILPNDFAVFAREIPGAWRALAIDLYNPQHNLLNLNQASAETDATGWAVIVNCTIASSTAQAADGSKSIALSSTAAGSGDAAAGTPPAASAIACVPGDVIIGLVSIRAATTTRSCAAALRFLDSGNNPIGTATKGTIATNSTTAWTNYSVTATAPVNAAKVQVGAYVTNPANGEVHYIDKASIRKNGSGTDWVAGGTVDTPVARCVTVIAIDQNGNPVSSTIKTAIDNDLQARREVNFLVYTSDAVQSIIDVNYTVVALAGVDTVALKSDIDASIQNYLNPATWGTTPDDARAWRQITKVRYLEVAQIINDTSGVDYISALTTGIFGTMGSVDITMPGVAPLPKYGTITGVVNTP